MSPPKNPSAECAWCGEPLQSAHAFHAVGASVTDPSALETEEDGHMIGIELEDRTVFALTPPPGSPAKEEEHDLWFNLCSESCAHQLQDRLKADTDLIDGTTTS